MKTFYSTEAQTEILFARNQRDLSLPDALLKYNSETGYYELQDRANFRLLGMLSGMGDTRTSKVKSWCVENGYRCSNIQTFQPFTAGAL